MQLTVGKLLQNGKYLINHPMETQGFGITYLATNVPQGQSVVIKTLHPALHKSRAFTRLRDRFIDIGSDLTRCQHPSVVAVQEIFQEGDWPFMVMEYVSGQSFVDIVQAGQPMAEMEALHYVRYLGAALQVSHRQDLVHANLKPRNIIRRPGTNVPVLVGYGISAERMLAAVQYAVPGFPHEFTAPEQVGQTGDRLKSADTYGLAAILYYLLTGHPPLAVADRQPGNWAAQFPLMTLLKPSLQQILQQGLAFSPENRAKRLEDWLKLMPQANNTAPQQTAKPDRFERTIPNPLKRLPVLSVEAAIADSVGQTVVPPKSEPPPEVKPEVKSEVVSPIAPTRLESPQVDFPPVSATAPTQLEAPLEMPPEPPNQRPRFRKKPLTPWLDPTPDLAPELPVERPRFRQEPIAEPVMERAPAIAGAVNAKLPLVPPVPSEAEQYLQQAPSRPYPNLPKPPEAAPLKKLLLLTGCIAAGLGITFGLALRFNAARSPSGGGLFHAEQEFPNREWSGTVTPATNEDVYIEEGTGPAPVDAKSAEVESVPSEPFQPSPMIDAPATTNLPKLKNSPPRAPSLDELPETAPPRSLPKRSVREDAPEQDVERSAPAAATTKPPMKPVPEEAVVEKATPAPAQAGGAKKSE
jgi:serine/threonine protein kinase